MKLKSIRPIYWGTGFVIIFFLLHPFFLSKAGDFLAPVGKETAGVIVLEGTSTVNNGAVKEGLALIKNNDQGRLVIVLHLPGSPGQLFAIQEEYPLLLEKKLKNLGLKENQIKFFYVPINDHPITLTEARFVMAGLAKEGVHSAVLITDGFHTRRSVAVYQQEGEPFNIAVIPHPCFVNYNKEGWWKQKEGIREFVQESAKLIYYLIFGYVSPRYVFYISN
jgi:uncharacterized SAM-binding protein YcdF (DUF218 family)